MAISDADRKKLWGSAGGECSYPDCPFRESLEEAHIVGESPDGPRGDSTFSPRQRDAYPNRILICANHHALIDGDVVTWTVDGLQGMKADHEHDVAQRGERMMTFEGKAEAFAVKAKKVTGGRITKPTRILPGSQFSAAAIEADEVTGLQIGGES